MIPRFALSRPRTLSDAFEAFDRAGGDAAWHAGGTELLQVMKMGLAAIGTLIDIKRLPELRGIDQEADGALRIGACATHRDIERSDVVARAMPSLVDVEHHVGNIRVRSTGTLGGNLAFAEPHSDPAALLLACDAELSLVGPRGERTERLADFIVGPFSTTREPDEIISRIRIPAPAASEGRAYGKFAFFERPAVGLAVRVRMVGSAIQSADVVVGSIGDLPARLPGASSALVGAPAAGPDLAGALVAAAERLTAEVDASDDINGSADYKRSLAAVLLDRVGRAAIGEAAAHA